MNRFMIVGKIIEIKDTTIKINSGNEIIKINLKGNFINHIPDLKLGNSIGLQGVIKSNNELYVEKIIYLKSM